MSDTKKLDLHGVRHEEVDRLVENFVLLNNPPLEIITGNSDKMTKLVRDVLDRHEIEWERWGNAKWIIL
tara:strand:+ start:1061 stop:1267 length:207 start_codon:yes stop_codon:yes gene_type:complete